MLLSFVLILKAHNNQVQADEQFRQELEANQKLADLYKVS
jgi:hypothetical protein